jgi:two-component system, NtrC family, nitrogen regulation response regulator NtrX
MSADILIVDDESGIRELLSEILEDEGYRVKTAENAAQAREIRNRERPDLVLLDIWMPDTDGISLLKEWAGSGLLSMPVVMMSGHGTIDSAVEATRLGAADYLEKPIALQKLLATITRALRQRRERAQPPLSLESLGHGPAIRELKQRLSQIAAHRKPLLLTGEPGCGFELCARFLHEPNRPWLAPKDNGGLSDAPLEWLEQTKNGLLFLEEVGDLGRLEQKGLLLLLSRLDKFNVRLVCATTRDLAAKAAAGDYSMELFQMLSVLTLAVPPLRGHREDIPEIASYILARLIEASEVPMRKFSTGALNALRNYDWPGNLVELTNAVRSLAVATLEEEIAIEDVKQVLAFHPPKEETPSLPLDQPLREARDYFERLYFEHHLKQTQGNITQVAERAGLERTHLYRKLKQLGLK